MDPSITITPSPVNSPSEDISNVFKVGGVSGKVAHGICITKSSLKPNISSCLVIYPPRSLYPDQATSIWVLQLGSNIAEKKSLHAAMDSLFSVHTLDTADSSSTDQADSAEAKDSTEVKPTLLWSALYIQDLIEGSMGPVVTTPTPDGNLNYNDLIGSTLKLFQKLDDEFFPETINTDPSDKLDDDGDLLES
ncbi:rab escort protein [Artemisia annua]|uniref:Rab escort protein n=1 Tax=Artemisia annua TaxID=35608 RepID=A0A2U1NRR4_ARTAN|nr:rab escort protein [Artemisia annua]